MKKRILANVLILFILGMTGCTPQSQNDRNTEELSEKSESTMTQSTDREDSIEPEESLVEQVPIFTNEFFIFPDSDTKGIAPESFYSCGLFTLRIAKNEIFARKGYIFKDNALKQYFVNMPWYKENSTIKGNFEDLNEIERENVTLLENAIKQYEENGTIGYDFQEYTDVDGSKGEKQSFTKDLDQDGEEEEISAYFIGSDFEVKIKTSNGKEHVESFSDSNIRPRVMFADFDITDSLLQFYIEADGPSGDPSTQIYSFDGNKIVKNLDMVGFITHYDGKSKIYSFDEYSVNCYFDLNKGLTPLPKENIVGKTVLYGNIQLFKRPGTEETVVITSDYLMDEDFKYEGNFQDDYIGVVPKNTPLVVTDIEFLKNPFGGDTLYYIPWLKVKTPDNIEGWFCLIYGD